MQIFPHCTIKRFLVLKRVVILEVVALISTVFSRNTKPRGLRQKKHSYLTIIC
jgi:hypothetical protein